MGGSQSREGLDLSDSDDSDYHSDDDHSPSSASQPPPPLPPPPSSATASGSRSTPSSIDDVEAKLQSLKLKYSSSNPNPNPDPNPSSSYSAKLYLHVGGSSPNARWILSAKSISYSFIKPTDLEDDDEEKSTTWVLKVGSKVKARVDSALQLKPFPVQRRVDFVAEGVWALKFSSPEAYRDFWENYQSCLFENTYNLSATHESRVKIFGKDFLGWAHPESADDSIWEDAEDSFQKNATFSSPSKADHNLLEEFEEAANDGIQNLALGALDNSFLVGSRGIQVVRNFNHGIQGKGVTVKLSQGNGGEFSTPTKALLMKAETNMLLMSPATSGKPHASGLKQVDLETEKVVTEWKFVKDGVDITMRDITNANKGAQIDASESTFLGLDDNRLCRWDMRDRRGMVQDIMNSMESPVLDWTQGHQFSRGTNFQCFATTGDGSIVVGSLDGKIRLYASSSMRMAKTAFPGLGSPVTHIDVTYDGKWILGTTDTYLILVCTIFKDKDGREKTGFAGRMGNRIAAPRLLKLTPLDSHLAGANNKFHGGQFSWVTENGKTEGHLVASVGKFSIIWDFKQVKNSHHECYHNQEGLKSCYCYRIVLKDESIVASRFMHEKFAGTDSPEAPLVVATPMKVSSFSLSNKRR